MNIKQLLKKPIIGHAVFWVLMYVFFVAPTLSYQPQKIGYMMAYVIKLAPQMLMAYGMLYLLIPHLLNKGRVLLFAIATPALLYLTFILYTTIRFYFFEVTFPEYYRVPEGVDYWWRITDFYYFAKNMIWFAFPAVILIAIQYFKHQQEALELREQKRTAELDALKNQLNPHFLFNTLNNLYALSLKKSDRTPEVIAKLSEILDYILYRCNEDFVPISGEVGLLDNYIALEKVRYGKRLDISFDHEVDEDIAIAPLLLLTFLENAFKHGVSQELNTANINIDLKANESSVVFEIQNSISKHKVSADSKRESIGLINVQKQLDILYPDKHELQITEEEDSFKVSLKLILS